MICGRARARGEGRARARACVGGGGPAQGRARPASGARRPARGDGGGRQGGRRRRQAPGRARAWQTTLNHTALTGVWYRGWTERSSLLTRRLPSRLNAQITRLHVVRHALPQNRLHSSGTAKRPSAPAPAPKRAENTSYTICMGALPPPAAAAGDSRLRGSCTLNSSASRYAAPTSAPVRMVAMRLIGPASAAPCVSSDMCAAASSARGRARARAREGNGPGASALGAAGLPGPQGAPARAQRGGQGARVRAPARGSHPTIAHWLPSRASRKVKPGLPMPLNAVSGEKLVNTHDAGMWVGAKAASRMTNAVTPRTWNQTAARAVRCVRVGAAECPARCDAFCTHGARGAAPGSCAAPEISPIVSISLTENVLSSPRMISTLMSGRGGGAGASA